MARVPKTLGGVAAACNKLTESGGREKFLIQSLPGIQLYLGILQKKIRTPCALANYLSLDYCCRVAKHKQTASPARAGEIAVSHYARAC